MKAQIARLVNAHEKLFVIDSSNGDASYRVCTQGSGHCNCPHYTHRLSKLPASDPVRQAGCKHLVAVRSQEAFILAATKAKHLSDAQLVTSLQVYQAKGNHAVAGAIRVERHQRAQAAAADQALRDVLA